MAPFFNGWRQYATSGLRRLARDATSGHALVSDYLLLPREESSQCQKPSAASIHREVKYGALLFPIYSAIISTNLYHYGES